MQNVKTIAKTTGTSHKIAQICKWPVNWITLCPCQDTTDVYHCHFSADCGDLQMTCELDYAVPRKYSRKIVLL